MKMKTVLMIAGGVGLVAFLVYRAKATVTAPAVAPGAPPAPGVGAGTASGTLDGRTVPTPPPR